MFYGRGDRDATERPSKKYKYNTINSLDSATASRLLTAASPVPLTRSNFRPFNPFTETPVQGVNWAYGPSFGQPIGTGNYQMPRTFSCSAGIRF